MIHRKIAISKLITEYNLKKGAELGVFRGETFKYLVETHSDLYLIGVDAYKEMPENIGKGGGKEAYINGDTKLRLYIWNHEEDYKNIMEFCSRYSDRTQFIRDLTEPASKLVDDNSLDFVFIDADHSEEGVTNDINNWGPKVKSGGFITGHDYSKGWPSVVAAVNKTLGAENITKGLDNVWIYRKS